MKMIHKFYDTCSLLSSAETLFDDDDVTIIISSISLQELENIKTSKFKDELTKFAARHILHLLEKNPDKYKIEIYKMNYEIILTSLGLEVTNDTKILACAKHFSLTHDDFYFVSDDLSCRTLAKLFFSSEQIISVMNTNDNYLGFKEVYLTTQELENFYTNLSYNTFGLLVNEYLIIYDAETKELVDKVCWTGETHRPINYNSINSRHFGEIKAMRRDPYQALAIDSFYHNKITLIKGKAGSGKSTLSLAFLVNQLETGKLDRIIVFCNTVAAAHAAKLGFYPGSRLEKLMDSQIGNMLASKFGDRFIVEQLIQQNKLELLPFSDIRGYDTNGMRAGIYITEAQNLDISLMKLALQRIGEDCICIIDGDELAQVDLVEYEGINNGMKRVSKVFRGSDLYGEVSLQLVHRSCIADLAQQL